MNTGAVQLNVEQYVFAEGTSVYTFTGSSQEDHDGPWRNDFEEVVRSFRPIHEGMP